MAASTSTAVWVGVVAAGLVARGVGARWWWGVDGGMVVALGVLPRWSGVLWGCCVGGSGGGRQPFGYTCICWSCADRFARACSGEGKKGEMLFNGRVAVDLRSMVCSLDIVLEMQECASGGSEIVERLCGRSSSSTFIACQNAWEKGACFQLHPFAVSGVGRILLLVCR